MDVGADVAVTIGVCGRESRAVKSAVRCGHHIDYIVHTGRCCRTAETAAACPQSATAPLEHFTTSD